MRHAYSSWLTRPLAALGLLLATAGATQAQVPAATFAPVVTYGTGGTNTDRIAVADVNGDGKPDLLSVNYGSNTAGVLLGNGNGTFQTATTYGTGGTNPTSIAVADVNGDGKPDLLVANRYSSAGVLLGNGNGTFQAVATYSAGAFAQPYSIAAADVNGDGKLDLLTANSGSSTAGVLLGNGNGTFQPVATYSTGTSTSGGTQPYTVAVADVNGDGNPDLVTANLGTYTAGVLLGNGNGTFRAATTYSTGPNSIPIGIAAGDVNGDGNPDLVTANANGTAGVLLGNGNGTFQPVATYSTGRNSESYGIVVADVNGDGKPDLLTANFGNNTAGVLLNTTVYAPILISLSLTSVMEGMSITITGQNLAGATDISFNGLSATTFNIVNSTTITATVPPGATTGHVNVTTPGGTSNGIAFTVTTTAPTLTDPAAGTTTSSLPAFTGTAAAGSTVTIYLAAGSGAAQAIGTTTAAGGGGFQFVPTATLGTGTYSAYATAQVSGQAVSAQSNTTTFAVDATAPTATVSVIANSPAPFVHFSVLFSEPVTGFLPSGVSVSNGSASLSSGSSSGSGSGPYIISVLPATNGPVTVSVLAGAARDAVGNPNLASNAVTVQYILTTWTPTLAAPTGGTTGNRPTFSGVAAAGSTVTLYAALGSGAAQAIGTTVADANSLFSFTPTTALADGSYTSYVTAQLSGQAVSANSNTNTFAVNGAALTATLTSANSFSGGTTNVLPFTFTATFSQPVTGFSTSSIFVSNGYVSSAPTGSGTTYTFAVTPSAANSATTVTLNAGAAQTAAGSPSLASGPYTLTFSSTLPPLPVLLSPADGSTVGGTFIAGGRASTNSFVGITIVEVGSGTSSYRSTTSRNGSFSTQFSLRSGVYQATAQAQLNNILQTSNTNTFTVDATGPAATISTTAGTTSSTSPIPFTVGFSEAVASFSASSVSVTNGTISSAITSVGNAYSFSVTPTASGPVTVTLPAGAVQDRFGNANASASSLSVTYVSAITATTWTGAVGTDWFDAGNWTQGVPTASVGATIGAVSSARYPLITTGAAVARSLSLNSQAVLTMRGGTLDVRGDWNNSGTFSATGGTVVLGSGAFSALAGSSLSQFWGLQVEGGGAGLATSAGATVQQVLTLNGNFATGGNPFLLLSNAVGTALVVNNGSNVVTGTVTVQRYVDPSENPGPGYRHYAAPVGNTTVADLAIAFVAPVVNPAYNTSATPSLVQPFPTVFGYDDSRLSLANNLPTFDKGFFSPAALTDPLAVGRGYSVNISASPAVDFVGALNNGDLTVPLTSSRATYADGGWQLLGNPYPAPLDYRLVDPTDRPGLEGAIYVYSSTSQYAGRYRSYVNGIGNSVLPLGQGFFARVAQGRASATLTFRNSQRLTAPDATAFQRPTADPRPLVQLELTSASGLADSFYAYAESGATPAFDGGLDAEKLPNPTGLNLAGLAAGGQPLAIDGRPAFAAATVLPLAVGVPAAGTYALSAPTLANLPTGLDAYLADDLTGQVVRLSAGTSYSFSATAAQATATIAGRFRLLFRPATALATAPGLNAAGVSVYPNPARARFVVVLPGLGQASTVQAELLNALGQVVRRQQAALPATGTQLTFDTAELAAGVYTLRLQAGTASLARRVVIE